MESECLLSSSSLSPAPFFHFFSPFHFDAHITFIPLSIHFELGSHELIKEHTCQPSFEHLPPRPSLGRDGHWVDRVCTENRKLK